MFSKLDHGPVCSERGTSSHGFICGGTTRDRLLRSEVWCAVKKNEQKLYWFEITRTMSRFVCFLVVIVATVWLYCIWDRIMGATSYAIDRSCIAHPLSRFSGRLTFVSTSRPLQSNTTELPLGCHCFARSTELAAHATSPVTPIAIYNVRLDYKDRGLFLG